MAFQLRPLLPSFHPSFSLLRLSVVFPFPLERSVGVEQSSAEWSFLKVSWGRDCDREELASLHIFLVAVVTMIGLGTNGAVQPVHCTCTTHMAGRVGTRSVSDVNSLVLSTTRPTTSILDQRSCTKSSVWIRVQSNDWIEWRETAERTHKLQ